MEKPEICIVTPALASANNGNWQTARRWAGMLRDHYAARLTSQWLPEEASHRESLLIALHARRSAGSVLAWRKARPELPLVLVLTGTDLYRDIHTDPTAQAALAAASVLVVLQDQAPLVLPVHLRSKCRVIYQSSTQRQTLNKPGHLLRAVMVGHLREEKSPETFMQVARLLERESGIRLDHIGNPLDPGLAELARQTQRDCPSYRWLGGLSHEATRRRIQRAHVLVHASRMEGGAHVIMEAVMSGTPVLASRVDGNVGMLGTDYGGYFDWNDAVALAELLRACRNQQTQADGLLSRLSRQCGQRRALFEPQAERQALLELLADLA